MSLPDLEKRLAELQELIAAARAIVKDLEAEIKQIKHAIYIEKLKLAWKDADDDLKWIVHYKPKDEIWYVFPYPRYKEDKDSAGQLYYLLSDLKDHVIESKHSYEGHQCKRGWGVGAYYIAFDKPEKAIEYLYEY